MSVVWGGRWKPKESWKNDSPKHEVLEVVLADQRAAGCFCGVDGVAGESTIRDDRASMTLPDRLARKRFLYRRVADAVHVTLGLDSHAPASVDHDEIDAVVA